MRPTCAATGTAARRRRGDGVVDGGELRVEPDVLQEGAQVEPVVVGGVVLRMVRGPSAAGARSVVQWTAAWRGPQSTLSWQAQSAVWRVYFYMLC